MSHGATIASSRQRRNLCVRSAAEIGYQDVMLRSVTVAAALAFAACSSSVNEEEAAKGGGATTETATAQTAAAKTPAAKTAAELDIRNFSAPLPNVVCSGQPTKEQFDALAAAGVQGVLHLRRKSEKGTGWEEARAAEAGVRFERLEIAGGPGLTRENVEAFAKLLASYGDDKILVSCASSNRVGAMFALKAVWLEGADKEAAMALGKRAGMKGLSPTVEKLLGK